MAISITLSQYLTEHNIPYEVMLHNHSFTAMTTAAAAHVSGDNLAKAVLIRDEDGLLMAVVPATHRLNLDQIRTLLGREVKLAAETDMRELKTDCDDGALPIVGSAFGLNVVWDDELAKCDKVFFEGGDHRTLIEIDHQHFMDVMAQEPHGTISRHM